MKKLLYSLLIAFGAIALVACSDDEGTNPGGDATPVVTIYQYDAPEGTNPDQTTAVRIMANSAVSEMYMLVEYKETKDAYIEENGIDAYCAYVCENGTAITSENLDQVIENLQGLYAITVVAKNAAGQMYPYEVTYKGLRWIPAGKTTVYQGIVYDENEENLSAEVNFERQDDANVFRVVDLFHQIAPELCPESGSVLTFSFDANKKFVGFETSDAPFVFCGFEDGAALFHGYYHPANYGSYCNVKQYSDDYGVWALVNMLVADYNSGRLYTGGYIEFEICDDLLWVE